MNKAEWLIALINGAIGKQGGTLTYKYSQSTFYAEYQGNHHECNVNDIQEDRNFTIVSKGKKYNETNQD